MIPLVRDADVVFVHHAKISAQVIDAMEHCKMITRPAIGFDNIDVDAATKKGIYVTNIPEYGAQFDVSNHVIMLMLVCVKKLWLLAKDVKQGGWDFNIAKPIRRLNGQILGLCGLGRIPRQVAFKAQALGMQVHPSRPCWIGCPRQKSKNRPKTAGLSEPRSSVRALICGCEARGNIYRHFDGYLQNYFLGGI